MLSGDHLKVNCLFLQKLMLNRLETTVFAWKFQVQELNEIQYHGD